MINSLKSNRIKPKVPDNANKSKIGETSNKIQKIKKNTINATKRSSIIPKTLTRQKTTIEGNKTVGDIYSNLSKKNKINDSILQRSFEVNKKQEKYEKRCSITSNKKDNKLSLSKNNFSLFSEKEYNYTINRTMNISIIKKINKLFLTQDKNDDLNFSIISKSKEPKQIIELSETPKGLKDDSLNKKENNFSLFKNNFSIFSEKEYNYTINKTMNISIIKKNNKLRLLKGTNDNLHFSIISKLKETKEIINLPENKKENKLSLFKNNFSLISKKDYNYMIDKTNDISINQKINKSILTQDTKDNLNFSIISKLKESKKPENPKDLIDSSLNKKQYKLCLSKNNFSLLSEKEYNYTINRTMNISIIKKINKSFLIQDTNDDLNFSIISKSKEPKQILELPEKTKDLKDDSLNKKEYKLCLSKNNFSLFSEKEYNYAINRTMNISIIKKDKNNKTFITEDTNDDLNFSIISKSKEQRDIIELPEKPKGLKDDSTNCYINSLLQCFYHIKGLRTSFIDPAKYSSEDQKVCRSLSEIMKQLTYGEKDCYSPNKFKK